MYKRQELTEANVILKDANATQEQVDNAYNQLVKAYLDLRLIPVSYTHLDVYKRQG